MNIPQGFIELFIVSVVGFVFKVVFGLVSKNEQKSDEADRRLEEEIKQLHRDMRDIFQQIKSNEHKIFDSIKDISVQVARSEAHIECIKGRG